MAADEPPGGATGGDESCRDGARVEEVMAELSLPPGRTTEPMVVVAAGAERDAAAFFDPLSEFFPLAYVSPRVMERLARPLAALLCERLAREGICAYIAMGDLEPIAFADLDTAGVPIHLIWTADCSAGQPTRAGAARMQWLESLTGAAGYFLVDTAADLYPQIFSLPFLPGRRR